MDWDLLIGVLIVSLIVLVVIAKITGQTLMEFLAEVRDFFGDSGEEQLEYVTQVYE